MATVPSGDIEYEVARKEDRALAVDWINRE